MAVQSFFKPVRGSFLQLNTCKVESVDNTDFPPVDERVGQNPDPTLGVEEYSIQRTTVQWADRCNLSCPGCYARPWLPHSSPLELQRKGGKVTPSEQFKDQLEAHGGALKEVYLLGLEPTLNPADTHDRLEIARGLGLRAVVATNGAMPTSNFDTSFKDALERKQIERFNVSLDSIDPNIHDYLRGRYGAQEKTMATIRHMVEKKIDFQVTITVWSDNYHTIVKTVEQLYELGVRGFLFHEGSLEGAPDHKDIRLRKLKPFEWRSLTTQLESLKQKYLADGGLERFTYPYIYFTEKEIGKYVVGPKFATVFFEHIKNLEEGDSVKELPFNACPAVDVPQVYLFGNDGPDGEGELSLCNMHTIQTGKVFARYNKETRRFDTVQDPEKNQMVDLIKSPFLCPAMPNVQRDGNASGRYDTPEGDLFHACRFISCNQLPEPDSHFGSSAYEAISSYLETWRLLVRVKGVDPAVLDEIESNYQDYSLRLAAAKGLLKN